MTTLQKFPVIAEEIGLLSGGRFAVIVDEAIAAFLNTEGGDLLIGVADDHPPAFGRDEMLVP